MTRDEVLALKPGRELDELVAEKVLKLKRYNHVIFPGDFDKLPCYSIDYTYECVMINDFGEEDGIQSWFFEPSTNIVEAWEVEEMIYEKGLAEKYITNLILITGSTGFHLVHATPEQRCKAALLAVMDGEDEYGD